MRILTNIYGDLINTYGIIYPMGTRFWLYGSPWFTFHPATDPRILPRYMLLGPGFSSARFLFSEGTQNFNGH
jgi:hypothetical protein